MSWMKSSGPFVMLLIIGLCVMALSIFDIVYDKGWMIISLAAFLNSLNPFPNPRAISGIFFAPKRSKIKTKIITISGPLIKSNWLCILRKFLQI